MRSDPPVQSWYLPKPGVEEAPPIWRVVYSRNGVTTPVEVCAESEDEAVMRAGMKRSALFRLEKRVFPSLAYRGFERVSVECLT